MNLTHLPPVNRTMRHLALWVGLLTAVSAWADVPPPGKIRAIRTDDLAVCTADADCIVTPPPSCCADCCRPEPVAMTRREYEREKSLCRLKKVACEDCSTVKCRNGAPVTDFTARCVASACVLQRRVQPTTPATP